MDRGLESLKPYVEIRVRRHPPTSEEGLAESVYRVNHYEGMTLHRALEEIYRKMDPTLAFRPYRCNKGICMSCLVSVDGITKQSCTHFLTPGDCVLVEEEKKHLQIRDLVTTL